VFAATESQALAPYKLQEQQNALQLVMKQMGLPIEYANAILNASGGNSNIAPILMALMLRNQNGGSGSSGGGLTLPADTSQASLDNILFPGGTGTGGDWAPTGGGA
jgi:hypothetical protein